MTATAEELLYDLAESVRPGARGFHGMCPEMAAKIVGEAPAELAELRKQIEELCDDTDALTDTANWRVEWDGPRLKRTERP